MVLKNGALYQRITFAIFQGSFLKTEIYLVKIDSKRFKKDCHAIMVSGYQKSVNAYDSSITDIAIMNDLLSQEEIEVERYTDRESEFYQKYQSLLDDLDFHAC